MSSQGVTVIFKDTLKDEKYNMQPKDAHGSRSYVFVLAFLAFGFFPFLSPVTDRHMINSSARRQNRFSIQ